MASRSHIILRGPDGSLYALKADDLEQYKVAEDLPEVQQYSDELQAIQAIAFQLDSDGNPKPNGNSCVWMVAMFAAVHEKPQPNDKMTYVNLDFSTKLLWDD